MAEATRDTGFTTEEVCDQAQGDATAGGLALLAYARERGETPEAAAAWLGRTFAPGWEESRGQGARHAMRWVALNVASLGGEVRSLSGDERRAEATVAGWPGEENLAFFRLGQAEADALYGVFGPIAEHLGLRFEWRRAGDAVTLAFEQAGAA